MTTEEWLLPPEMTGHWLQQASTKRQWQTEHHKELEQKLAEARAQAATLLGENETLRVRASLPPPPPMSQRQSCTRHTRWCACPLGCFCSIRRAARIMPSHP